jgi:formylglycine-generating enzyme required for sulfatase activity
LAFIATLSWEALAAERTAIPDDPKTQLYPLLEEEDSRLPVPLLVSNGKGYAIRCHDQEPLKIVNGLGFSMEEKQWLLWLLSEPRKSLDDPEIIKSAYNEQAALSCDTSKRKITFLTEGKADNKRYLIHFGDLNHEVLYELGCQGLVDALGLTWQKADSMEELIPIVKRWMDSFSREYINCKAGVPVGLFRDGKGPKMVGLPGGTFRLGDINGKGHENEQPVHKVELNSFAISRYEITVDEYKSFAEETDRQMPVDDKDRGNYPVTNVSWEDAIAYAAWLSEKTGKHYRLPTEEEWEYAARAGTDTLYGWGNHINQRMANYREKNEPWDKKKAQPVGSFKPNAFMIYDMVGNVLEWTCSKYELRYQGTEQECFEGGNKVVLRGGSFIQNEVRIAKRYSLSPENRDVNIGFRVVRVSQ